jgi:PAS domain S-box-containing protein
MSKDARIGHVKTRRDDAELYRLLVESITDYAIYMLNPAGIVTSWNAGARRFKGYEAFEIIGEHFSTFYTEIDKANGIPQLALRTAVEQGRFEQEGWRVRKDGSHFWAHVIIDPIRNAQGEIAGFAKVTRDLTERMESRRALRETEDQFRLLVQGVTDYAIYMLTPAGLVDSWNPGAERIKGYTQSEVIGTHFSRFYTEEDRQKGMPAKSLATATKEGRWEREGWRVRKDGTRFLAHVIIDAIRDETGTIIGFAKITRDITERKRQQDALDQAHSALLQSQKMEAIGQLTGGIAHDFNNLLTAILNSLELLRKWVPDQPRPQSLLNNAIFGAERGSALTARMLAFARRQELKIQPIDFNELILGMSGLIEGSIGPTIDLDIRLPDSLPRVRTDANQLEAAMLNLAINARDAMPAGGHLTIAAQVELLAESNAIALKPGRYVAISIADTGNGMDEATLSRAAEPFFTTKGPGKGTGLGLSMAQGLAEQSGGALQLSSQPGVGTSVTLWFSATDSVQGTHAETPMAATASRQNARILVVDDDSLVRVSVCALLEELGYFVQDTDNGVAALQMLSSDPSIELVLTDQLMPEMTGLQLSRAIRVLNPVIPIILATGYAELSEPLPSNIVKLAKPFRSRELQVAIESAMRLQSGH